MADNVTPINQPTQPKPRTSQDVQTDYNNLLFRVGVAERVVVEQKREIKMYNETLDQLRLEYNTLLKQEQATVQAVAAAKAEADKAAALAGAPEQGK